MHARPTCSAKFHMAAAFVVLLTVVAPAGAQTGFQTVPYELTSGLVSNAMPGPARVWEQELSVPGALSLRVIFAVADLGGDEDRLVVRNPEDGEVQVFDRLRLRQWNLSSAYFNGDRVVLALDLAAGSTGLVVIHELSAQFPAATPDTLCGTDDRTSSSDDSVCRLIDSLAGFSVNNGSCTGFLVNDRSVIVSAGHCHLTAPSLLGIAQFRVPASNADPHPAIADQFPVDTSSIAANNSTIGNDWAIARLHPNSSGETASSRYGWFTMEVPAPFGGSGFPVRVTGYGSDTTPATSNFTQQTATGPLTASDGPLRHRVNTMVGNSGSPIIRESTGEVIGIHTNGGCNSTPSSNNSGTRIDVLGLQSLISQISGCTVVSLADSTATVTCPAGIFNVSPTAGHWNVVGVSSGGDWDISIGSVSSAASSNVCDFLVANGHLGAMPPRVGVVEGGGASPATLEHETGGGLAIGTSACATFPAGQIVELHELTVTTPGPYTVNVAGSSTLKWHLFAPGIGSDWRPRSAAIASGTASSSTTATVQLVSGIYALVVSRSGGPPPTALTPAIRIVPASTFSLDAFTSGGGTGDLCLSISGMPAGTANVILLVSTVPGNGGGPFLGLEVSPLLVDILGIPAAPFSIIHFPAGGNPYSGGPIAFPAGTFAALAGQVWEARAVAYSLPVSITGLSQVRPLTW